MVEEFSYDPSVDMLEIDVPDSDTFLIVKETLTRIGIVDKQRNIIWQLCHILYKRGKYYVCHYNELKFLDGENISPSRKELAQRNGAALLLENWGLTSIVQDGFDSWPTKSVGVVTVADMPQYQARCHYKFGAKNKS